MIVPQTRASWRTHLGAALLSVVVALGAADPGADTTEATEQTTTTLPAIWQRADGNPSGPGPISWASWREGRP